MTPLGQNPIGPKPRFLPLTHTWRPFCPRKSGRRLCRFLISVGQETNLDNLNNVLGGGCCGCMQSYHIYVYICRYIYIYMLRVHAKLSFCWDRLPFHDWRWMWDFGCSCVCVCVSFVCVCERPTGICLCHQGHLKRTCWYTHITHNTNHL